jgi:phosphoribosylcarboxyaminoimidazole (NCAIR) mutase
MERKVLKRFNVQAFVEIEKLNDKDVVVVIVELPKEIDIEQLDISNKKVYFIDGEPILAIEFPLVGVEDPNPQKTRVEVFRENIRKGLMKVEDRLKEIKRA